MKAEKDYQLHLRQICLFFIAFSPILRVFMLPSLTAQISGEDMWISSVFNVLIDFVSIIAIIICCKCTDDDFYTLIKNKFGDAAAKVVFIFYAAFFLFKAVLPICEHKDYIELTLYNTFPSILNYLPLFLICFYISLKHLRVIGRCSDIMWLISIIGFAVLLGLSVPNADFGALLPVGARGFSAISKAAISALNWYGDAAYFLFFIGNFKLKKHGGKKIALSYIFSAAVTVVFMMTFYGLFKSIAFRERFALTELSTYSTVINNIGRFDYIGIFLILLSSFFALSLPVFFSCYAINRAFDIKYKWILPLVLSAGLLAFSWLFSDCFFSVEKFFTENLSVIFFIFGNAVPLVSPLLTLNIKKNEKVKNETF